MTDPTSPHHDEDERREDAAYATVGFVVAALALTVAGSTALSWVDKAAKARETLAMEAIPDVLASWPSAADSDGGTTFLALLAPLIVLALSFSTRWNGITGWEAPAFPRRYRWPALGVAAALIAGAVGLASLNAGRDLGVATLSGVVWLHDGAPRGEVRWADAEEVRITCWDGALTYDVAFPGGGVAPLGDGARSELGRWIDRVTLVDQTLRAYGVPRVREGETACLRGYDGGLIPSERARFGAVVAG